MPGVRRLPTHEVVQAERVPAWYSVLILGSLSALAVWALTLQAPTSARLFLGWRSTGPVVMADAFGLWAVALATGTQFIATWLPAARRSLVPHALVPFTLLAVHTGAMLLLLMSDTPRVALWAWLAQLVVASGLIWWLFHRQWHRGHLELLLVLGVSAVLVAVGIGWLSHLSRGESWINLWSTFLAAPPRQTSLALLILCMGWLGPAVYLPWRCWAWHDPPSTVWLPVSLGLSVSGTLALTRALYFTLPGISVSSLPALGLELSALVGRVLGWLLAWGVLALFVGAGWQAALTWRRERPATGHPLAFVAAGLVMIGLATGVHTHTLLGAQGVLWMLLAWALFLATWLTASHLLPELSVGERVERRTLETARLLGLLGLLALPPGPAFWGLAALWAPLDQIGAPRPLLLLALLLTLGTSGLMLWRERTGAAAPTRQDGVAWGILGPFLGAGCLVMCALLHFRVLPLLESVARALLQAD
jgi:hypothetical protein